MSTPAESQQGPYATHWERVRRDAVRGAVRLGLLVIVGLPATALVALAVEHVTQRYPMLLHGVLLVAWLIAFTWLALRHSRVACPRCATVYGRGRGVCNCPRCGLRMFDDGP